MFMSTVGLCCRRMTRKKLIFLVIVQVSCNGPDSSGCEDSEQIVACCFLCLCNNMNDVEVNDFRWCGWGPASAGMSTLKRSRKGLLTVLLRKP